MSTDIDLAPTDDFPATGLRLVFGPRGNGRASHLYGASERAQRWDGVEGATHAVGSRFGGHCYVAVKVTGRGLRYGIVSEPATKCRVTIGLATGEPADVEVVDAWLIGDVARLAG